MIALIQRVGSASVTVDRAVVGAIERGILALIGVEPGDDTASGERLLERGVLAKDTHAQVIRLAPPLIVERADLDWLVEQLAAVLSSGAV